MSEYFPENSVFKHLEFKKKIKYPTQLVRHQRAQLFTRDGVGERSI